MTDRITYCDVCECAECPKYGDDCDGDKRNDDLISRADAIKAVNKEIYHSQTDRKTVVAVLSSLPSAENSNAKTQNSNQETQNSNGDLIYRADAIEAVCGVVIDEFDVSPTRGYEVSEKALSSLPSAEAKPTVIRSRSLMPTKDFMEWAKRIRETNPNAVVIPCDAEVVSAEAVQGWIPCNERLPRNGDEYFVTIEWVGRSGTRYTEVYTSWYAHDNWEDMPDTTDVIAWMPLPKPYREDGEV